MTRPRMLLTPAEIAAVRTTHPDLVRETLIPTPSGWPCRRADCGRLVSPWTHSQQKFCDDLDCRRRRDREYGARSRRKRGACARPSRHPGTPARQDLGLADDVLARATSAVHRRVADPTAAAEVLAMLGLDTAASVAA